MHKHIAQKHLYALPSGLHVHPCRMIHKDGTIMWKHALLLGNMPVMPTIQAHEAHIIKTAQRLEELNSWCSNSLETWECIVPIEWYNPAVPVLSEGISCYFTHTVLDNKEVFDLIQPHILDHEYLEIQNEHLFFKRC